MRLLARAKQLEAEGRDIIHLEIGEPDFPTPQPIVAAAHAALANNPMHYTAATGLPALKARIAAYYQQRYHVSVAPQRIVITAGASAALLLALAAVLDLGQEILLTDPGYPCNANMVNFLGARVRRIPVGADNAYQFTAALIQQHWSTATKAVLLASPSNPTGTLIPEAELVAVVEQVTRRGGVVIVDEIYHGLVYGQPPPSVLNITDHAFVINSFSKYFGMTGWRLGWLILPEKYSDVIDRFAQNIYLAASTPAQYAALAAFDPATLALLETRREEFQQRRDVLLPALIAMGFDVALAPQGAFYIYASCARFTRDSLYWCEAVLENAGVAIAPGVDFGAYRAQSHVRFAYTTGMDKLHQGLARLRDYIQPVFK